MLIQFELVLLENLQMNYNIDQHVREQIETIVDELIVDDQKHRVIKMVVSLDHDRHAYREVLVGFQYKHEENGREHQRMW
jgi:hypothetical protein